MYSSTIRDLNIINLNPFILYIEIGIKRTMCINVFVLYTIFYLNLQYKILKCIICIIVFV